MITTRRTPYYVYLEVDGQTITLKPSQLRAVIAALEAEAK